MPSISIVLATFNGARFLDQQLQSLATQTLLPSELIITDDQSTDDTVAIARTFARTAPFVVTVIVNEERLNFRENFYKGVRLARSDIIMFCDQDDIWHAHKVASLSKYMQDNPELLLAYHQATVTSSKPSADALVLDPSFERQQIAAPLPDPWHFARGLLQGFRRDLTDFDDLVPLGREHFSDDILGHDRWYFFLALSLGRIGFLDHDLLSYRQHGQNAFGADARKGLIGNFLARVSHDASSDRYGMIAAQSRARILRAVKERSHGDTHPRLNILIDAYEEYAERLDRRHRVYTGPGIISRGRSLARSSRAGDYFGNPWGFDAKSILRDALSGVLAIG